MLPVRYIKQHPAYDGLSYEHDICILTLALRISSFGIKFRAIELPQQDEAIKDGSSALAAGWGNIFENGPSSSVLRIVHLPTVNQRQCNKWYDGEIRDGEFCAGPLYGGRDSCRGDSGGPLTYNNKQIGIVSWGYTCGRSRQPGVYTRVAHYRDWIDANM